MWERGGSFHRRPNLSISRDHGSARDSDAKLDVFVSSINIQLLSLQFNADQIGAIAGQRRDALAADICRAGSCCILGLAQGNIESRCRLLVAYVGHEPGAVIVLERNPSAIMITSAAPIGIVNREWIYIF